MAEDIIRVLRVLEYVGPRAAIEEHLKQVIHGVKVNDTVLGRVEIRAATIGVTPDVLAVGQVEQLLPPVTDQPEVTGTLCSVCMEPQRETPSGVTCENGHGGAEPFNFRKHVS